MKTRYTMIRLTPTGFIEHEHIETRTHEVGKIHFTAVGELYVFIRSDGDKDKLKAIMINKAIGDAVLQIKEAEERIEKLRGMRP